MEFRIFGKRVSVRRSPEPTKLGVNARVWIDVEDGLHTTLQYVFPSNVFNLGVHFDDDEDPLSFRLCVPPLGLYVNFESRALHKIGAFVADALPSDMGKSYCDRDFSLRIFDWAVWWNLGVSQMGWSSTRPKWRNGSWHFFGSHKLQSEKLVYERDVLIPMPERSYRWHAKLYRTTWGFDKLPRLFDRELMRVQLDSRPGEQIPKPGKGENSWDCGEDALFGSTAPACSIEEAVGGVVGSVLRDRKRYGGSEWRPGEARA